MAVPITISAADLVPTAFSAPSAGSAGQSIAVSWTVQNQGNGPANPTWFDDIILSTTSTGTGPELQSSPTEQTTTLAAGASYSVTKNVTLPWTLPGKPGTYYLILRANETGAYEAHYPNNNLAVPITLSAATLVTTPTAVPMPPPASDAGVVSTEVRSPVFSADGTKLAAADANRVDVWNIGAATTVRGTFTGHTAFVNSVGFSPRGGQVVSSSNDNTVRVSDASSFAQVSSITQSHASGNPAVLSQDGSKILAASGNSAMLYNAATGALLGTFTGHTSTVLAVALSPDGTQALTGSADTKAMLWSTATFASSAVVTAHTAAVNAVAFSPNGGEFLTASDDQTIRFWQSSSAAPASAPTINQNARTVKDAKYSADGKYVVSTDGYSNWSGGNAYLFQRSTGYGVALFTIPQNLGSPVRMTGVALSPDETTLATTFEDDGHGGAPGGVYLWTTPLPAVPIVPAVALSIGVSSPLTIVPGQASLFSVSVSTPQPGLVLHVAGTASANVAYAGSAPNPLAFQVFSSMNRPPTDSAYGDLAQAYASNLQTDGLFSPAPAGTYYVLVTAPYLTAGSISATITAMFQGFYVSRVEGGSVGNAGKATIRIRGTGLAPASALLPPPADGGPAGDAGATALIVTLTSPSSTTISPTWVGWNGFTTAFATFDLTSAQVGAYSVNVTQVASSTTLTLAQAVNVGVGAGPNLKLSMQAPPQLRQGRTYSFTLNCANLGDGDAVAPFVSVTSAQPGSLRNSHGATVQNQLSWLAGATGWPSGVLPAGATGSITFQAVFGQSNYSLTTGMYPEDSTPFSWGYWESLWGLTSETPPGSTYQQVLQSMRSLGMSSTGPLEFDDLLQRTVFGPSVTP
jgi:WD40 repeat protein